MPITGDTGENPTVALTFEQLKELLSSAKVDPAEQERLIKLQAEENARANKQLLKPENADHPGKSVFAYPEGDRMRPRSLRQKTFWCGGLLNEDISTAEEIELLNQLTPGEYACVKSDDSTIKVTVKDTVNPISGEVVQREVWFPHKGKQKDNLRSQKVMLREMIAQAKVRAGAMA